MQEATNAHSTTITRDPTITTTRKDLTTLVVVAVVANRSKEVPTRNSRKIDYLDLTFF